MSVVLGAAAALTFRAASPPRAAAHARAHASVSFRRADPHRATRFSASSVSKRRATRLAAGAGDADEMEEDSDSKARKPAEDDAEQNLGDSFVQDEITSQLKYQTKLYQAQQFLEGKKEEFVAKGEEGKSAMEEEAQLARDRASLELGMRASEIDDQLAEMLDETAAARAERKGSGGARRARGAAHRQIQRALPKDA